MNKLYLILTDIGIITLILLYGLLMLPYLLWNGIKGIILLDKKDKRPDFDLGASSI